MDIKKGKCTSCDYTNQICPKCGEEMHPREGILECNSCGSFKNLSNKSYKIKKNVKSKNTVKYVEDLDPGEGVTEICPKCGHNKATYELKQTRSADEAPTRFFTCLKCKHKWREYD